MIRALAGPYAGWPEDVTDEVLRRHTAGWVETTIDGVTYFVMPGLV